MEEIDEGDEHYDDGDMDDEDYEQEPPHPQMA
jgi:hypothetical protein